jgi:hypothetical protein
MGYNRENGKPVSYIPPGGSVPEKAPYLLARHCVEEYSNLRDFLPQLYAEQLGKPFDM